MRIVTASPPPPQKPQVPTGAPAPQKPRAPSYSSTLVSPHAPTWVESISHFFQWIWSRVSSLFSWFLPQKKKTPEPLPAPAPEIAHAVQRARMNAAANKSAIPDLLKQTAASAGFSLIFRNSFPFVAFVANKTVNGSTHVLEKIANYTFPKIASHWKKVGGLAITTPIVWYAADYLGHPLGKIFLFSIGMNAFQIITQASAASQKQREMRLRQLTA